MLTDAIRAAAQVRITIESDAVEERELGWGEQLEVSEIAAFGTDAEFTDQAVAAYVAKYATKSADGDPTNLTRAFTTLLNKAGLRRIRFHGLRHSTATLLLEQGVELVVSKELLGNAHIGVTAPVYAPVRLRLQHDAIDILNDALGPQGSVVLVIGRE